MKKRKLLMRGAVTVAIAGCTALSAVTPTNAAVPTVVQDDGAFVRLLGNPADGTAKFQFGWTESTPASEAAGYWIGLYDVTNSHYEWNIETGPTDLPERFFRNARPTADLPNGDYKVVFFVRAAYEPTTNISEIDLPFTVNNSEL